MSRISFILPVYKPNLDTFSKCLKSLCDQSIKDWEAIIVLDGPNDGARDVVKTWMKGRECKVVEIEHGGACKARNEGAKHANSPIWVFWDCDCVIEPDAADTWLMVFDKSPEVAFVYSGYRFLGEKGAINSEPFDPWLLRVRNYVSSCFPLRREFFPGWDETLESLQDWDFWLSVVEKGGKGKFLRGYAFATAAPDANSISGKGCTDEVWFSRVAKVKEKHKIPYRDICVSSLTKKHEGIWLAKMIDANYEDYPSYKPHKYKTIIQVGFSFLPGEVEAHVANFKGDTVQKKVIFYTCDDIIQIISRLNLSAIWKYSALLNSACFKQFVEDKTSADLLTKAGFNVEVMPMPTEYGDPEPLPEKPKWVVDCSPLYGALFDALQLSLPDIELVKCDNGQKLSDFTGMLHFWPDRTLSTQMRRAILGGRHVISNVQSPFCNYVDDTTDFDVLIPKLVEKLRECGGPPEKDARDFYIGSAGKEGLINALA